MSANIVHPTATGVKSPTRQAIQGLRDVASAIPYNCTIGEARLDRILTMLYAALTDLDARLSRLEQYEDSAQAQDMAYMAAEEAHDG
ncbi:MAG: hypothetical protein Q7O66_00820 [Dehalococcoidia bacterium]|nr:hypothetical protein [Dehalococcoidia bacterium]